MDVSKWISYGLNAAKVVAAMSWCVGFVVTTLHDVHCDSLRFGTIGSIVKNGSMTCVVISTGMMNLYVWLRIRALRHLTDSLYEASVTAMLLFLNFLACFAFIIAGDIFSMIATAKGYFANLNSKFPKCRYKISSNYGVI